MPTSKPKPTKEEWHAHYRQEADEQMRREHEQAAEAKRQEHFNYKLEEQTRYLYMAREGNIPGPGPGEPIYSFRQGEWEGSEIVVRQDAGKLTIEATFSQSGTHHKELDADVADLLREHLAEASKPPAKQPKPDPRFATKNAPISRFAAALEEYRGRKDRAVNPEGWFDGGGRFHLSADEQRDCCDGIRPPSKAYPYSEMLHARTATHVAHLYGVDESELRQAASRKRNEAGERKAADQLAEPQPTMPELAGAELSI